MKIIPDASSASLLPIIKRKVVPDSIVYSDCWHGYNALDVSELNIIALTIQACLQIRAIILTALRIFDLSQAPYAQI